ncbi:PTS mannose transporter subunit IID [Tetragenococcus halophilus subsp. flandriensis]|uniref:PTS system mannose/fructose/sorbose family transporter subunit IID n=1 Tax=Tetragenococcus halophilus TaxID=51669 RepID=UPI0023EA0F99|nr:PTS system mannose/fructose/sorbose family transporter subunit IID [Tetragenococcus halophilus]GMA07072.1 PTS mannose transporter subunit IID [Tetragenococcus halophilus subsp. flandriensis]
MAEEKTKLTKRERLNIAWRNTFAQGSWNYERMQNGGFVYAMIPAIKKLYTNDEDRKQALQRHLEFYNTHPYLTAPVLGVTLAMEEERASGAPIDDAAIQGVKVGMMGPLAGVGDPVFWFTVRPMLGALGASLALGGNVMGPIIFFVVFNIIRWAFLWYTQEFGYKAGSAITDDMSGGLLQDITRGASILGMFVLASLVQRWVDIDFQPVVSETPLQQGDYVDWSSIPMTQEGLQTAFQQVTEEGRSLTSVDVTTLQENLDELIPGLAGLLLTLLCMWLLRKNVSPIVIILSLFVVGIVGHVVGLL